MSISYSFAQGGSRTNRSWPGHRHPKTATPHKLYHKGTEAQTAPATCLTRRPYANPADSQASQTNPSPFPKPRSYRPHLARHLLSRHSSTPPPQPSLLAGPQHHHPESPHSMITFKSRRASTGCRNMGIYMWYIRASKTISAYSDSPATSQAPNPISEATPAYPDPTATFQARARPEGHAGLCQFIGHFPDPPPFPSRPAASPHASPLSLIGIR